MATKNILILGAGPGGAITACALAATDPKLNITVLDSRKETRRNYALNFAKDAIDAIQEVLAKSIHPNSQSMQSLKTLLQSWKGRAISTLAIESELAKNAHGLGVKILRKDEYKPFLTADGFDKLLNPNNQEPISGTQLELQSLFQNADLIIGADGAHSQLRQKFMQGGDAEKRTEVKNLQYFIELKYQTHQQTKSIKKATKISDSSFQGVAFETMNAPKSDSSAPLKPATIHFFVGQTTYDRFGNATSENPWNLNDLQEKALNDPIIQNQACKITHYLLSVLKREGCCLEPKIKGLPITIYRSQQAVAMRERKVIVLVGDALSGAVFARGVNKAFLEAAQLAKAVNAFFSQPHEMASTEIPEPFKAYEQAVFKIYEKERKWAELKASGLKILRTFLRVIVKPVKWILTPIALAFSYIKSYFFKKPTLGELIEQLECGKKV